MHVYAKKKHEFDLVADRLIANAVAVGRHLDVWVEAVNKSATTNRNRNHIYLFIFMLTVGSFLICAQRSTKADRRHIKHLWAIGRGRTGQDEAELERVEVILMINTTVDTHVRVHTYMRIWAKTSCTLFNWVYSHLPQKTMCVSAGATESYSLIHTP